MIFSLLQTIDAIDAVLAGELTPAADSLVGRGAAVAGAGGEVHLAFGVLVHEAVGEDGVSKCWSEEGCGCMEMRCWREIGMMGVGN